MVLKIVKFLHFGLLFLNYLTWKLAWLCYSKINAGCKETGTSYQTSKRCLRENDASIQITRKSGWSREPTFGGLNLANGRVSANF